MRWKFATEREWEIFFVQRHNINSETYIPNGILFGISGFFVLSAFTVSTFAGNQICVWKTGETTWLCAMLYS